MARWQRNESDVPAELASFDVMDCPTVYGQRQRICMASRT
jgi:hypothetical protein